MIDQRFTSAVELDLAYLGYWRPFTGDVFDGYREEMDIDPGV